MILRDKLAHIFSQKPAWPDQQEIMKLSFKMGFIEAERILIALGNLEIVEKFYAIANAEITEESEKELSNVSESS